MDRRQELANSLEGPIERSFYARDTLVVARELLGKRLVRCLAGQRVSGLIVETEAYIGQGDTACHAARGRTPRNAMMFGPPGFAYVYFVYGMHHCLNVVTREEGFAAAVLVRALEPQEGIDGMQRRRPGRKDIELTNGPAKLCYALAVAREQNGADLVDGAELWIEWATHLPPAQILTGPRIGVRGDDRAVSRPWRFWIRDHPYVSKR